MNICDQLNSGIICPAQQHEAICNIDTTAELINRCRLWHRVIYGVELWNGVLEWSGVEFGVEWSSDF